MGKEWKEKHDGRIGKNAHVGQYDLEAWYLYFISYRNKESKWLGQFDKFSSIWRGKGMISADMRIGNKKVGELGSGTDPG